MTQRSWFAPHLKLVRSTRIRPLPERPLAERAGSRGYRIMQAIGLSLLALSAHAIDPVDSARVFVQTGNELHATMVRFSPDGRWLAACDALGGVVLWDAHGGRQFSQVHRHTGMCLGLDFTPDGRAVLSSGGARNGNEIVMTRWLDSAVEQTWRGHRGQVQGLAASLDSQGAWSLGEDDGLFLWRVGESAPVRRIATRLHDEAQAVASTALVLDAKQQHAWIGRRDGSILSIDLDAAADETQRVRLLTRLPESIGALALSPDAKYLAVAFGSMLGAQRRDVALLDSRNGQTLRSLASHPGPIAALAFSADGALLASASQVDMQALLAGDLKGIRAHETVRIWRVADGHLLGEARNQRNRNGMPFTRGALQFAPATREGPARLGLALWDEAPRVYELADGKLRLTHLLEGRGLSPRQLQADANGTHLLTTDGRPRVEGAETRMNAEIVRREFGRDEDWTPERLHRLNLVYGGLGWMSSVQRAALWNLKTGRLDKVVDWQRAAPGYLGLDAQGRFVSMASLFPATTMVAPLKTNLVREAVLDPDGRTRYSHFGFEPWEGPPDEIFVGTPAPAGAKDAGAEIGYSAEVLGQSPAGRWQAVAGILLGAMEKTADGTPIARPGRLFVHERLPDGKRVHRHDIALPGTARALAFAADERTLWLAGSLRGLENHDDHEAWLIAVDLSNGTVTRQWRPEKGVGIGRIVAHPGGDLLLGAGRPDLVIWDKRQETPQHVHINGAKRNLAALSLTRDGHVLATADLAGWTTLWDWPDAGRPPAPRWSRQLDAPAPHLLSFSENGKRLFAGAVDGSVRILATADGAESARLIRFDDDAWISIIPEGYFAASQDGDRWVNVRVGDRVYGIDQFYDVFYRPDIVERRLAGQSIAPLIRATLGDALRQPPPAVRIEVAASPDAKTGAQAALRLHASDSGGGIGELRLLHNGKLVELLHRRPAASAAEFSAQVDLELVAGGNDFTVVGLNGPGTLSSRPASQSVDAVGTPAATHAFVLAVGIDHFHKDGITPLRFAVKDASDVARVLERSLAGAYGNAAVSVTLLNDAAATRPGLEAALERLRREARPDDLLVWFVASHGTLDGQDRYGIVLHDWDGRAIESSLYSATDLLDAARRLRPFRQLIVLDTCHAGGVDSLVKGLYDARLSVLARNMGLHILASANATEEALDGYLGNGLFTHTLLQGLDAARADRDADRLIGVRELGDYARRETKRIARLLRHSQDPLLLNYGKDVILRSVEAPPAPSPTP
jgi:WD40 repeat protein